MHYNKNQNQQLIERILLTLCLSLALCMKMAVPNLLEEQTAGQFREVFWNISNSLGGRIKGF